MLVGSRMTENPITIEPGDALSRASQKMQAGGFRRLPVVNEARLVGIVTERDLREHRGHLEHIKINAVMTEHPLTATPDMTLEEAAGIMLAHQIGGLPVIHDGRLVGIITATDVMRAFLDVMGATNGGSTRIDFMIEGEEHGFIEASRIVAREGAQVLGVGTYRRKFDEDPVCYLRLVTDKSDKIAKALSAGGFHVLGVHRIVGQLTSQ
jgi:acetoin utilization protein AcuB